jgi:hypothetical protein
MGYIDLFLLNVIERSCRGFQRLTGKTNVWLALQLTNLSIVVYFAWAGMFTSRTDLWLQVPVAIFCAGLFYLLTQTIFKESIEVSETNAYRRVAKGFRNPRRVRDAVLRISFLTLSFVLSYPLYFVYVTLKMHVVLVTYCLIVLTTAVLYLLACDPLPPCPGRLREWVRGRAPSRVSAS